MFCTVLCSIFPYFLFLYRVKGVVDISPCNTTDVARAGCYFLPFHAPWSWGGESAHRAQIRAVGIQHPAFVCFFPAHFHSNCFSLLWKGMEPLWRERLHSVRSTALEREKIHDFKREKHSQFNERRP